MYQETCSEFGCSQPPSHHYAFPGGPEKFICEEHRAGRSGLNMVDPLTTSSLVAIFHPIEGYVAPAPPTPVVLCTHKLHNAAHVEPAMLAYAFPAMSHENETIVEGGEERTPIEGFAPGVACAPCVIEIVNMCQAHVWSVQLSLLGAA